MNYTQFSISLFGLFPMYKNYIQVCLSHHTTNILEDYIKLCRRRRRKTLLKQHPSNLDNHTHNIVQEQEKSVPNNTVDISD